MSQISKRAVREASAWFVELNSDESSEEHQQRWQRWYQQSADNQAAWGHVEKFQRQFQAPPTQVVRQSVDTADQLTQQRRLFLKRTIALTLAMPFGYAVYRQSAWYADYRTSIGEVATHTLPDGTELTLNTRSAVSIQYNQQFRTVTLLRGEALINTSKISTFNAASGSRPFQVKTAHGLVRALGTTFSVYAESDHTRVHVFQHATLIRPASGSGTQVQLEAGQGAEFDNVHTGAAYPTDASSAAWARGMLIVDDWSMAEFTAELARYRPGILNCDESAASMRISGSFPLDNTDHILDTLPKLLPVRVSQATRYWITISKA